MDQSELHLSALWMTLELRTKAEWIQHIVIMSIVSIGSPSMSIICLTIIISIIIMTIIGIVSISMSINTMAKRHRTSIVIIIRIIVMIIKSMVKPYRTPLRMGAQVGLRSQHGSK